MGMLNTPHAAGKGRTSSCGGACTVPPSTAIAASLIAYAALSLWVLSAHSSRAWLQQPAVASLQATVALRRSSRTPARPQRGALLRRGLFSTQRQQALGSVEQSAGDAHWWAAFWRDHAGDVQAMRTLQALKDQAYHAKLQRLTGPSKDVEPQDMAGVDLAMAATLQQLAQQTGLQRQQAVLRQRVTAAVFDAITKLQHPADCTRARKLVCSLNKGCGFGCQLHHAVHCLSHAIALNRTLVLQAKTWRYAPGADGQAAWEALMAPASSCGAQHVTGNGPAVTAAQLHDSVREVTMDIVDHGTTSFEPPAMPPDVLLLAGLFNSRPEVWWVGVLSSYLLRPSATSAAVLQQHKAQHAWRSPVVGMHIRRTDKLAFEAAFHSVDEYMRQVQLQCDLALAPGWRAAAALQPQEPRPAGAAAHDWQRHEPRAAAATRDSSSSSSGGAGGVPNAFAASAGSASPAAPACSVYVATDEPTILQELRQGWPHIRVISNPVGTDTGTMQARASARGAAGVYYDVMLLAASDVVVGTFSSQVSRLAYEVAQANSSVNVDASLAYRSIDSMWYMGGMQPYELCVTTDYTTGSATRVAAGQHLVCPFMHVYNSQGLLKCSTDTTTRAFTDTTTVYVPPGTLARCESPSQVHAYRSLLPDHMRMPAGLQRGV